MACETDAASLITEWFYVKTDVDKRLINWRRVQYAATQPDICAIVYGTTKPYVLCDLLCFASKAFTVVNKNAVLYLL